MSNLDFYFQYMLFLQNFKNRLNNCFILVYNRIHIFLRSIFTRGKFLIRGNFRLRGFADLKVLEVRDPEKNVFYKLSVCESVCETNCGCGLCQK